MDLWVVNDTIHRSRIGCSGDARADQPRCVQVLATTAGCSMAAMIVKVPPQGKQFSISEALARQELHEALYDARE